MTARRPDPTSSRGFLSRLAHDTRGNALAIMAAFLIPLAAFSGSAIDMARLYTVRVRLQQACDAGALAGRKSMDINNNVDLTSTGQAQTFFKNNFQQGWFKTKNVSFTPTITSDYQVAGTASADVPMTLMGMFGQPTKTLTVTCQARYDIADTDIVFVLDTTGSMACLPSDSDSDCTNYVGQQVSSGAIQQYNRPSDSSIGSGSGSMNASVPGYPGSLGFYVPEKTGSRIAALRTAVVNFYSTLKTAADVSTHIRYGFVTYTSTVNAGRAIMDASPSYMVGGTGNLLKTWTYQSRKVTADYTVSNSSTTKNSGTQIACDNNAVPRNPSQLYTYNSSGQATETKTSFNPYTGVCTITSYVYGPRWTYQPVGYDVSQFLTQSSVDDPSRVDSSIAQWQGCVEAPDTTAGVTSFDNNNLPGDLNPDLIPDPSSATGASSWRPMWTEVVFGRNYVGGNNGYNSTANMTSNGDNQNQYGPYFLDYFKLSQSGISNYALRAGLSVCGKPIRRIAVMSQSDVSNYVNASDFRAIGGTYHDTGMIWGTRLLSRNGIFASDNSTWSGRQPPNRVIVFLTDGDMAPTPSAYGMYGIEYFDKRVTGGDYANQKNYHNARFLAECTKAKSMGISVWTVSIAPSVTDQMKACATSSGQALFTTSGSDLADKFAAIAKQVAMLRVSQ